MFVGVHFDYVLQLILRKDMPRVRYAQEKVHSDQDEGCQNAYHEKNRLNATSGQSRTKKHAPKRTLDNPMSKAVYGRSAA